MSDTFMRMVEIERQRDHRFLPSSCSALAIIEKIFDGFDFANDVFILSKGHASTALYAVLQKHGFQPDTSHSHAVIDRKNHIRTVTGSLGHGLPIGIGMALGKQMRGEPGIVHVLMGDAECEEGSVYEAASWLGGYGTLGNLRIHVDFNARGAMHLVDAERVFMLRSLAPFHILIHYTVKADGIPEMQGGAHKAILTDAIYERIRGET